MVGTEKTVFVYNNTVKSVSIMLVLQLKQIWLSKVT